MQLLLQLLVRPTAAAAAAAVVHTRVDGGQCALSCVLQLAALTIYNRRSHLPTTRFRWLKSPEVVCRLQWCQRVIGGLHSLKGGVCVFGCNLLLLQLGAHLPFCCVYSGACGCWGCVWVRGWVVCGCVSLQLVTRACRAWGAYVYARLVVTALPTIEETGTG